MKRPLCFALAIFLSCQPFVGCTSWTVQTQSPQEVIQEQNPDKVRVRLTDGNEFELGEPGILGDSLDSSDRKRVDQQTGLTTSVEPGAVPFNAIDQLAIEKVSASKTVGASLLALLGVAVIGAIAIADNVEP